MTLASELFVQVFQTTQPSGLQWAVKPFVYKGVPSDEIKNNVNNYTLNELREILNLYYVHLVTPLDNCFHIKKLERVMAYIETELYWQNLQQTSLLAGANTDDDWGMTTNEWQPDNEIVKSEINAVIDEIIMPSSSNNSNLPHVESSESEDIFEI